VWGHACGQRSVEKCLAIGCPVQDGKASPREPGEVRCLPWAWVSMVRRNLPQAHGAEARHDAPCRVLPAYERLARVGSGVPWRLCFHQGRNQWRSTARVPPSPPCPSPIVLNGRVGTGRGGGAEMRSGPEKEVLQIYREEGPGNVVRVGELSALRVWVTQARYKVVEGMGWRAGEEHPSQTPETATEKNMAVHARAEGQSLGAGKEGMQSQEAAGTQSGTRKSQARCAGRSHDVRSGVGSAVCGGTILCSRGRRMLIWLRW